MRKKSGLTAKNVYQDRAIVREGIFGKIITAKEIKENLSFSGSLSTIRRLMDGHLIGAIERRPEKNNLFVSVDFTPKNSPQRIINQ